jgi:hypothetical protein
MQSIHTEKNLVALVPEKNIADFVKKNRLFLGKYECFWCKWKKQDNKKLLQQVN